jgi:hypothetical protein
MIAIRFGPPMGTLTEVSAWHFPRYTYDTRIELRLSGRVVMRNWRAREAKRLAFAQLPF